MIGESNIMKNILIVEDSQSLKKYNGEIKINTYEKEFMVNVVIPLLSERN